MRASILISSVLISSAAFMIATTGLATAQTAPKVVSDIRKSCQIAVPADWAATLSTAYSPGKKISATVHGMPGQTFDQAKATVKQAMTPIKTLQDDGKRLMYTMNPGAVAPGKTGWYVVASTTPVCTLSFTFDPGADDAGLRKIADSLAPVAK